MGTYKLVRTPLLAALIGVLLAGFVQTGCARTIPSGTTGTADVISIQGASHAELESERQSSEAPPAATRDVPELEHLTERRSYAMGMVVGSQFRMRSVEVDLDLYVRGIRDALADGQTLLTEAEARSMVTALQKDLKTTGGAMRPAAGALSDIKVSFKLDPRLTRAQYMGDRWVSKPTFTSTVQAGPELTVEVRAQGFDAKGGPVPIDPQWIPADPDMVAVAPGQGRQVAIIVKRAGETRLKMVSGEVSQDLSIKGAERGNGIQVEISQ